jgi:hypothetical protein
MTKVMDLIVKMRRNPKGVNIQNDKGMAKAYQVRQVLKAIEHLEEQKDATE